MEAGGWKFFSTVKNFKLPSFSLPTFFFGLLFDVFRKRFAYEDTEQVTI